MSDTEPTHCYLGTLPGDVFGFIAVDMPKVVGGADCREDFRRVLAGGGRVERMTIEEGRAAMKNLTIQGVTDRPKQVEPLTSGGIEIPKEAAAAGPYHYEAKTSLPKPKTVIYEDGDLTKPVPYEPAE